MKAFIFAIVLMSSTAFASEKTKINGKMYIAHGFDNNDLVEVTVVGTLPNSCHRNPFFEIERKNNDYAIRLYAYYAPAKEGCRQVSMAYTETINFGMMEKGQYAVKLVNKKQTLNKKLDVRPSTSDLVDEFLYGNVTGISEEEEGREIELVGVNPVSCLVYDKMYADVQDVMIVLRPKFKEIGPCENKSTPFKIKYTVPYLESAEKGVLLHVRVMNGRSYNYLYQNRL